MTTVEVAAALLKNERIELSPKIGTTVYSLDRHLIEAPGAPGLTHGWRNAPLGNIDGRLALMNVFDRSYPLRDGSGVGVGAPQYGARRTIYAGISSSF
ncbi:hypothetical protein [Rugamonas rubra]|uniref:TonB dependent receptor n=1 Tax=Rugamonas rubra TaxID=758825 RepID=A0A1I4RDI1_9BURK|nr:hypothetical protein [Rugamonas rubra]SFM50257.1 hypothetical protein SAMN02982985_04273 [Rugamonas rubra]